MVSSTLRADREVRTDEVMYVHKDNVAYNVVYTGRTDFFDALDTDPVWQIKRVTSILGVQTVEYAQVGKYLCRWTDRTSYFDPEPAPESDPGTNVNVISANLLKPVKNPKNQTVITDATPTTETSFSMPLIKRFKMINRGAAVIQYSYQTGDSGVNYASIFPGASTEEVGIDDQTITIYLQSPSPSQRLEVITWE